MLIHREQLFLRIAYAGAPLSGKTETLKALLANLRGQNAGEAVFSPLSARGRTLYFDWVQYQGGTFRDGPLHCQITSVPGQATLHRRRRLLIEDADSVVFVIDSQRDQLEANQRSLAELKNWLGRGDLPPIRIIYQANKRDLAGALSLDEIREGLALGNDTEIHESSALLGEGVRVCFVAAVRACVLRAEELRARGQLQEGEPDVTTGEQLLERLRSAEDAGSEPEAPAAIAVAAATADAVPVAEPPPPVAALAFPAARKAAEPAPMPELRPAAPARRPERPAVMPMAAWLASEAQVSGRLAPSGRQTAETAPSPIAIAAPLLSPRLVPPLPPSPPSPQAMPGGLGAEPPGPVPPARPRGAVVPISDWRAGLAARTAPAVPAPAALPAPMAAAPPPSFPAPSAATVLPAALALPTPWLPGGEATLIDVWPPAVWSRVCLAANPRADPPATVSGTLRARIGAGWQARAWGAHDDLGAARAEWSGMVAWLQRLGDMMSSRRCVVLCGSAAGWCVWQVAHQELTFDLLIRQCLEQEQLSKHSVQVLARVATDFILATQEFALRNVELPVHFQTLAHENRSTVYSAFLPPAPVPMSSRDALAELASELRAVIPVDLLRSGNVTEALRELELLRETRPQLVPTVEVLQSLLIGE